MTPAAVLSDQCLLFSAGHPYMHLCSTTSPGRRTRRLGCTVSPLCPGVSDLVERSKCKHVIPPDGAVWPQDCVSGTVGAEHDEWLTCSKDGDHGKLYRCWVSDLVSEWGSEEWVCHVDQHDPPARTISLTRTFHPPTTPILRSFGVNCTKLTFSCEARKSFFRGQAIKPGSLGFLLGNSFRWLFMLLELK